MNQALHVSALSLVSSFVISALLTSTVFAQVNGPGPSPSNLFDIVLDLPGDEDVVASGSIGGVLGQTQLNITDGGNVGTGFDANFGSEVNISGGSIGRFFAANSGSEVNISGGEVGDFFDADGVVSITGGIVGRSFDTNSEVNISGGAVGDLFRAFGVLNISGGTLGDDAEARFGSVVNISGGSVGDRFDAFGSVSISGGSIGSRFNPIGSATISGGSVGNEFRGLDSDVELVGAEFRLNGVDFSGGTISLTEDDVFTGTLADGSSFIFSDVASDELTDVTLTTALLPPADFNPIVIHTPVVSGPSGVRSGQTLTLQSGGLLRDNFAVVDATLNVQGGIVGDSTEAYNSVVNISGGTVGDDFNAITGSEVNISGGSLGGGFEAYAGSEVNISGGTVDGRLNANSGSEVNISGGILGRFSAAQGSVVVISGGAFRSGFGVGGGSSVELVGGEFRLNGVEFSGSTITLLNDNVFTGTLADGSSFIFGGRTDFLGVSISVVDLPPADLSPIEIDSPVTSGPSGLRAGQSLNLQPGGSLRDNFAVVDATLNVNGGGVGDYAEAYNGVVNIGGGTVGDHFRAESSEVNISGGTLGAQGVFDGSVINISGGTVGSSFAANNGSVVNLSGGTMGRFFTAFPGSIVNISGGTLEEGFFAAGCDFGACVDQVPSVVNIIGSEFYVDGVELDALVPGEAFTITNSNATLSGLFANGEQFSFDVGSDNFFIVGTLNVTLSSPVILGDVNLDGAVDFLDISPFIGVLSIAGFQSEADINRSGVVDFSDIAPFIEILSGN